MKEITFTEENYLKAIYSLGNGTDSVNTNALAEKLETKAASVSEMIKKLSEKKLVKYKKYQGASLTAKGKKIATTVIRNHRLWECFLVEKLSFKWDEVHDMAEELEHINSALLTERLDEFLGFPKTDPHGDPIPDSDGNILQQKQLPLSSLAKGDKGVIIGVNDSSTSFLQFLDSKKIGLGTTVAVIEHFEFDQSVEIKINNKEKLVVSHQVAVNLNINTEN